MFFDSFLCFSVTALFIVSASSVCVGTYLCVLRLLLKLKQLNWKVERYRCLCIWSGPLMLSVFSVYAVTCSCAVFKSIWSSHS